MQEKESTHRQAISVIADFKVMLTKMHVLVQQSNISSVYQKGVPSAIMCPLHTTIFPSYNYVYEHSDVSMM